MMLYINVFSLGMKLIIMSKFHCALAISMELKSLNNWISQVASLPASVRAIYSASVVDSDVHVCLLLNHVIGASSNVNTHPLVDLLTLMSDA